jgi:hypothetical protein
MITLVGRWETGWLAPDVEAFIWRQLAVAYAVDRVIMVPNPSPRGAIESADSVELALESCVGTRVFLIPEQTIAGTALSTYQHPADAVYIFGNGTNGNAHLVRPEDDVVTIYTPAEVDFFAVNAAAIALHDRTLKYAT